MSSDAAAQQVESYVPSHAPWWQPVVFGAMAGGMAWGIRGQYGHETGAMIAGLLVSLVLTLILCPGVSSIFVARAVALCTVAMGWGGSMTYGQTLGLTQNPELVGQWAPLCWGLLGTAIKGGVWIGFAGLFLGMGLGGKHYRPIEMLLLMLAMVVAYFIGAALLNAPFDPENKRLPLLYFSAHWRWEPGAELDPRPEYWGGLWIALLLAMAYIGWRRRDGLAWRLGLWGVLGGAIGFPLGQCLQAYHAWNPEVFATGFWKSLDPHMNWWNMMETTFGATMGAVLGLGAWLERGRIQTTAHGTAVTIPLPAEWILLTLHLILLTLVEFFPAPTIEAIYDLGLIMGILPMVLICGARWSPYLLALPVALLPIAGKTVLELVYKQGAIATLAGWFLYFILPMALAIAAAVWARRHADHNGCGRGYARRMLLLTAWLYFGLNFAIFRFPFPWTEWTSRTPNGIIFAICLIGLTLLVFIVPPNAAATESDSG